VTGEMNDYLRERIAQRRNPRLSDEPAQPDLLSRLIDAEMDGQRLTHDELLGFFQLLLVGGQETTANLINNAILCFLEHPDQLAMVRANMDLLPSAIEEVLRYRSPLQWVMRTPTHDIDMGGQTIPAGKLVLAMIGSANRDPSLASNDPWPPRRALHVHGPSSRRTCGDTSRMIFPARSRD
jgi:cytochrome P450